MRRERVPGSLVVRYQGAHAFSVRVHDCDSKGPAQETCGFSIQRVTGHGDSGGSGLGCRKSEVVDRG